MCLLCSRPVVRPSIELDGAGCCSFQGARPPPQHVTKAAQVETGKQSAGRARQRCLILVVSAHTSSRVSSASLSSLFSPVLSSAASQEGGKGGRSGRSLQRRRESGDHQMSFCTGGFVRLSAVVNIWCSEWGDSAHWPLVAFSGLTNGQEWPKRANWSSTSQTRKMATETSCLLAVGSALLARADIYSHSGYFQCEWCMCPKCINISVFQRQSTVDLVTLFPPLYPLH